MKALKKIAGGFVPNGSTLAIEGRWQDFANELQAIATAAIEALTATAPPTDADTKGGGA